MRSPRNPIDDVAVLASIGAMVVKLIRDSGLLKPPRRRTPRKPRARRKVTAVPPPRGRKPAAAPLDTDTQSA